MTTLTMKAGIASIALAASCGLAFAQTGSGTSTTGGAQMSQAECQSLWNTADSSKAGSLTQSQAQAYVSDFKTADANNDGRLSSTEFQTACQKGMVRGTASSGGSTGSSSGSGSMGSGSSGGAAK